MCCRRSLSPLFFLLSSLFSPSCFCSCFCFCYFLCFGVVVSLPEITSESTSLIVGVRLRRVRTFAVVWAILVKTRMSLACVGTGCLFGFVSLYVSLCPSRAFLPFLPLVPVMCYVSPLVVDHPDRGADAGPTMSICFLTSINIAFLAPHHPLSSVSRVFLSMSLIGRPRPHTLCAPTTTDACHLCMQLLLLVSSAISSVCLAPASPIPVPLLFSIFCHLYFSSLFPFVIHAARG